MPRPRNGILNGMTVTMDGAGRIVIPKAIRDREGLQAGTELNIRVEDGKIKLEVPYAKLEWRDGMPVLVAPPGSPTITHEMVNEWIEQDRNSRGLIDGAGEVEDGGSPGPAAARTSPIRRRRPTLRRKAGGAAL